MAVFIPITGMKADGGGPEQRRQVTLFTTSGFSALQSSHTSPQASGRGRKRSCSMKAELTVAANFNGELQGLPPAALSLKQKIPRPPNAFMLFANDWRRKLASQFPKESNKDISIRLGGMWKNMEKDEKEKYFQFAREVDAAHKKKYPDYVYNPKEARMRKALREQSRGERQGGGQEGGGSGQHRGGSGPASWAKHRHIINHRQPIMVGEQTLHHSFHHHQSGSQRGVEDVAALNCKLDSSAAGGGMIQNFSDYLSDLSYPVTQPNEFIVPDLDQSWYSYLQGPVQNATYLMRTPSDKVVTSSDWGTHFSSENAASISSNTQNGPEDSNGGYLNSSSTVGSREHQQLVNGSAGGHQINSPAVDKTMVGQDQTNNIEMKDSMIGNGKPLLELSQIKVENQNGVDGNIGKDVLRLPAFQQAFGSTEIGRFSQHEGFFESSLPQPEAQPEPKNIPEPVTPPRNKLPDVDFQNPGSFILSPSSNMSPSMWGPLLYSPTIKDGSSCFGSPTFPQQSPLTNFIDYSLLSGTEFMQSGNDEIIDLSSHCSTGGHASVSGSNGLYPNEEKELQILLSGENGSTNSGDNVNNNDRNCESVFSNAIKPLQKLTEGDKQPLIMEICSRRAPQGLQDANNRSIVNKNNCPQSRIRLVEEFADQDLKMNCVNRPPVIISENEKICVILESSNVGLDSCSGANSANSINNKQFTNL